jgi:regulator of cell morphogenesis and NO signaling
MKAELGDIFEWEYLMKGPDDFEVKITKREISKPITIWQLVAKDFRNAEVFQKFGIDFCCGGKKTIEEVCQKKGINQDLVWDEINQNEKKKSSGGFDFINWTPSLLCEYIIQQHHGYVKESLPIIYELSNKVARVHGGFDSFLVELNKTVILLAQELVDHLKKEEDFIFPFIKNNVIDESSLKLVSSEDLNLFLAQTSEMENEHEVAGSLLKKVRELTNDFKIPDHACTSYRVLFLKLEEFEKDLHQHVHLENNILLPKVTELLRKHVK